MNCSDFVTWVDMDTYEYLNWQNDVIQCMREKDILRLKSLMENEGNKTSKTLNKRIVEQFDNFVKGILAQADGKRDVAVDLLNKAAAYTIPKERIEERCTVLLSENEILILLIQYSVEMQNKKEAERVNDDDGLEEKLYQLMSYLHSGKCDIRQEAKLYPYAAYMYADIQIQLGHPERGIVPCQDAIALMRKHNFSRILIRVLNIYLDIMKTLGIEGRAQEEKNMLN